MVGQDVVPQEVAVVAAEPVAGVVADAALLGAATVLGVLVTEHVAPLARHGLALAAGVTLYVAASNLVPEFQGKRGWLTAAAFFGGALAYFCADRLLAGVVSP